MGRSSVLGGGLEYAFIRRTNEEWASKGRFDIDHSYYQSIQRPQPDRMFSRAATILAISESVLLPDIDWTPGWASKQAPSLADLGFGSVEGTKEWAREWDQFIQFLRAALKARAFSSDAHQTLVAPDVWPDSNTEGRELFGLHHLIRLLLQFEMAADNGAHLFMPEGDQQVIRELTAYSANAPAPPPVNLPDFNTVAMDPDGRSVALLAFEPPDVASIIPVRHDKQIRKYGEAVHGLWSIEDPVERERKALSAMRAVVSAGDAHAQISKVFEATGWWLKPLSWASVPGASWAADAKDGGSALFERHRRAKDWLLIRPRMQDISLRDYLRRIDNY